MAWDDIKVDDTTSLTAAEYNDLVAAVKHTQAQAAKWAIFDTDTSYNFKIAGTSRMQVIYSSTATTLVGDGVSGDDLVLKANTVDSYSKITLHGNTAVDLAAVTNIRLFSSGTNYANLSLSGSDATLTAIGTNYNISLVPNGTGKVKFGTWTTNADAAVNGTVTILDSTGTLRKLATIA